MRLYVPEQYRWFDFGGTMRLVAAEADLQAGYVKFQTRETQQIVATMRQGDKFAKLRAAANLKTQLAAMDQYRATIGPQGANSELQSELKLNETHGATGPRGIEVGRGKWPNRRRSPTTGSSLAGCFRGRRAVGRETWSTIWARIGAKRSR